MNKYSSYKDSGVEWIGDIPNKWSKEKLKYLFDEKKSTKNPSLQCGSISFGKVIYKDDDRVPISTKESYQELLDGEFLINPLNLNYDLKSLRIGKSEINVVVSQGYIILKLNGKNIPEYFNYLLKEFDIKHMKSLGQGIRQTISYTHLKDEYLITPPIPEQQEIVSFLDDKTQKIDSLIQQKEKKIELLKEKRTSLINNVVTKGLDSNLEMKDSGVEWIGEIPSHWEITKFKYKGDVIIGLSYKPENMVDKDEGTLVMRSSNVQNGKPSFHDNVYVDCKISDKLKTKEGDILICSRNGSRKLIGKNCLITKDIEGMSWGVFMTMYRTPNYKYFYWLLNSPVFKSQSGLFLTSTINQLTVSTLENMIVPYVNNENEQQQIVDYLDKQTEEIDTLIQLEQKKIDNLKEYRQSLISEVVTGKIRVCEEDTSFSLNSQTI